MVNAKPFQASVDETVFFL